MEIAWGPATVYYLVPPARRGGTFLLCGECARRFREHPRYRRHWGKRHAQDVLGRFLTAA